ncbi:12254_t:CDS:2 [Acaulospora morrowiae]|uniref:12254_t:CDS:1 n=1 Tax=Acaulospora morrowiae TaxID=94023 RepID=A0A9N9EXQ2_9GLOM|nr:12254_t:CDS:2 [Acaulospora morrowiae]
MLTSVTVNSLPQLVAPKSKYSKISPDSDNVLRIFLIQTALGLFNTSGGYKANYYFLSSLAKRGHICRSIVLCWENDLLAAGVDYTEERVCFGDESNEVCVYRFVWGNVEIIGLELERYLKIFPRSSLSKPLKNVEDRLERWLEDKETAAEYDAYRRFIMKELTSFRTTHFIFNDSVSLKIASALPPTITRVFICHACEHLSFGPYGGVPGFGSTSSQTELQWLKEIEGVWAVSNAIKDYIKAYGKELRATHLPLHPAIFGEPPFKRYHNFDSPYVLAINPGSVKGYVIFKELAEKMSDVSFAAVKSWSLSEYQLDELGKVPNIKIMPMFKNMDELWPLAKVLLVPSIWYEAFGLVVVEAMLRGIPVICSDVGGLTEAKCGVKFGTIHVNVISGERETDQDVIEKMGIYKVPPQNIEPWVQTLRSLLNDRDTYEQISQECRDKSIKYIQSIDSKVYEKWLSDLRRYSVQIGSQSIVVPGFLS